MRVYGSLRAPVEVTEELLNFIRHGEAIQDRNAVAVQPELRRERHHHSIWRSPANGWAEILRSVTQPETVSVAQSSIHLEAGLKLFRAEGTLVRTSGKLEGTAEREGIAELPRIARKVLFRD